MMNTKLRWNLALVVLAILVLGVSPIGAISSLGPGADASGSPAPPVAVAAPVPSATVAPISPSGVAGAPSAPAFFGPGLRLPGPLHGWTPSITAVSPAGASPVTYSAALGAALSAASGFDAVSWTGDGGLGIASPTQVVYATNPLVTNQVGCLYTWVGPEPSQFILPATPSSAPAGTAAFYEIFLASSALSGTTLTVAVVNGTASLLYTSSAGCGLFVSNSAPGALVPPGGVALDSPAAVAVANAAGGSAFAQSNPAPLREWAVQSGAYTVSTNSILVAEPSLWDVVYASGCAQFFVEIDAQTGAALANSTHCTPSYPVTFTETGLPAGTSWSVGIGSDTNTSTSASIGFSESNGSVTYFVGSVAGFIPTIGTGLVTTNGNWTNVSVTFAPASTYSVTFQESGLPTGDLWSVVVTGLTQATNTSSVQFYEINGTHRYDVTPVPGFTAIPNTGHAHVAGAALIIPIAFTAPQLFPVNVTETGLPAGAIWGADVSTLGGATDNATASTSMTFWAPNGTVFVQGATVDASYNTTAQISTVTGAPLAVTLPFTNRSSYEVWFNETGLAPGVGWFVSLGSFSLGLNSTTGASLAFGVPNGSYSFTAGGAPGYNVTPGNGTVLVNGASVNLTITFTGPTTLPSTYSVTFSESGLPASTSWSVTLQGDTESSATGSIMYTELNGTYAYTIGSVAGYTAAPASGNAIVNGANVSQPIVFTPVAGTPTYAVTFTESGLTSGTSWSVTLAGSMQSSTGTSIAFTEANGSYAYTLGSVTGYTVAPTSGTAVVAGAPVPETVTFTPTSPTAKSYSITFTETGLPKGTTWSVTLQSATVSSTTTTVVFTEPNGSYTFTVGSVTGYTSSPASGPISVSGAAAAQSVAFTSSGTTNPPPKNTTNSSSSTFLGLPGAEGYALIGILVLIIVVIVLVAMMRMRKGSGGASTSPPPSNPTPPPAPVEGTSPPPSS